MESGGRGTSLTKPLGSLGRLESLGYDRAGMTGAIPPLVPENPAVLIAAGERGALDRGYPPGPRRSLRRWWRISAPEARVRRSSWRIRSSSVAWICSARSPWRLRLPDCRSPLRGAWSANSPGEVRPESFARPGYSERWRVSGRRSLPASPIPTKTRLRLEAPEKRRNERWEAASETPLLPAALSSRAFDL